MPPPTRQSWLLQGGISLALALGVFALVWTVRTQGYLQATELQIYDSLLNASNPQNARPSDVVVVGITDEDLQEAGQYPYSDNLMAQGLNKICDAGASVVAVDVFRDTPVPDAAPDSYAITTTQASGTNILTQAIKTHRNILWVMELKSGSDPRVNIPPPAAYRSKRFSSGFNLDRIGYSDQAIDPDGEVRRATLSILDAHGTTYHSLAFVAAVTHLLRLQPDLKIQQPYLGSARLDDLRPNDAGYADTDISGYQILIDYKGPTRFPRYSFTDVLQNRIGPRELSGKVVMLGYTTQSSVKDFQLVPIRDAGVGDSSHSSPANKYEIVQRMRWGIEVHAAIADQLIRAATRGDAPTRFWNKPLEALWILAWMLVAAGAGFFCRGIWTGTLSAILGSALIGAIGYGAFRSGWWLPTYPCVVGYAATTHLVVGCAAGFWSLRKAAVSTPTTGFRS